MGRRFSICTTVDYILWRQGQLLNQPEAYHQIAAIFLSVSSHIDLNYYQINTWADPKFSGLVPPSAQQLC
jgi:hypothetical protein